MDDRPASTGSLRQALLARLSDRFRHHVEVCLDLRNITSDPLQAAYLCPEQPFLVSVPAALCRALHTLAFPLVPDGAHPFIRTVRAMDDGLHDYAASPLCAYYATWHPDTAAAALGIPAGLAHPDLLGSPFAATFPWEFRSPPEARAFWTDVCARDYRQHGFSLGPADGWKAWGPVTADAGRAEFARLYRAYRSIRTHGYRRHAADDGDIQGIILRHGDETRILLGAGQHRAAVLAALGETSLPLRLTTACVNREDVARWPNVRRGIFTVPLALRIFDRVFAGRQPYEQATDRLRTIG